MSSERGLVGITAVAFALALALGGLSCADFERGPRAAGAGGSGGGDGGAPADGGALSFAADVHPLLLDGCGACHAAGGQASSTALIFTGDVDADRAATLAFVNTAAPAQSRLLGKASGTGHGGGAIYTPDSTEHQTILGWITQGTLP